MTHQVSIKRGGIGVTGIFRGEPGQEVRDHSALPDRLGDRQHGHVARIAADISQIRGHLDHTRPGGLPSISPPASQRRSEQKVQRQVAITGLGRAAGDGASSRTRRGIAGHAVVEDLAQPLRPGLIELGEVGAGRFFRDVAGRPG